MMDLYEIVERYSGMGDHRTATSVEAETLEWLEDLCLQAGADVVRHPYIFDNFEYEVTGTGSAQDIRLDALYYSAVGLHEIEDAHLARLSFDEEHSYAHVEGALDRIAEEAIAAGKGAAIVATGTADADLCQINRHPQRPGPIPICLAAGSSIEQLETGPAGMKFGAQVVSTTSENLTARFSSPYPANAPLVVTTPLSGWFACAGERGTGLAIALSVSAELAKHIPVLLILPTGHELGYLGAARFLDEFNEPVAGVLHLGSCIADIGAHGEAGYVRAIANLETPPFASASAALLSEGINLERARDATDPACWMGESELWAPGGLPMISIAGTAQNFHTPADIVTNATTPELMTRMNACVLNAAKALIR